MWFHLLDSTMTRVMQLDENRRVRGEHHHSELGSSAGGRARWSGAREQDSYPGVRRTLTDVTDDVAWPNMDKHQIARQREKSKGRGTGPLIRTGDQIRTGDPHLGNSQARSIRVHSRTRMRRSAVIFDSRPWTAACGVSQQFAGFLQDPWRR